MILPHYYRIKIQYNQSSFFYYLYKLYDKWLIVHAGHVYLEDFKSDSTKIGWEIQITNGNILSWDIAIFLYFKMYDNYCQKISLHDQVKAVHLLTDKRLHLW